MLFSAIEICKTIFIFSRRRTILACVGFVEDVFSPQYATTLTDHVLRGDDQ